MNELNTIVCSTIEMNTVIPKVISLLIKIITLVIPIFLIVISMIKLRKIMGQVDDSNEISKKLLKRIKYACVIIILPLLISIIINVVVKDEQTLDCFNCITRGDCNSKENIDSDSNDNSQSAVEKEEVKELITVSFPNDNVKIGENYYVTVNGISQIEKENFEYISSDESVLMISNEGIVTGIKEGTATMTVKLNAKILSEFKINVVTKDIPAESITVESPVNLAVGDIQKLTPIIEPTEATNKDVEYTSSDTNVVTVDSSGIITAIGVGEADIYAKIVNSDKSATTRVIVKAKEIPVEKINLEEKITIKIGKTSKLTPEIEPSNATNKTVTYSSSNTKVATVDSNGNIKAVAKGSATITVTSGSVKTTTKVTVTAKTIAVESIKVDPSVSLKVGDTKKLTPVIEPSNATNKTVTYSSSNTKVAAVDSSGLITAIGAGKVEIYSKVADKVATTKVTVTPKKILVEEINLSATEITIKVGESYTIGSTIKPTNATNKNLLYSSSNTNVGTVTSAGKVTGKSSGTTIVTVKSEDGNKSVKLTVNVIESHKIHFLKTSNSSDCILLESNGHYALVDTARSQNSADDYPVIDNYLKKLNVTKLDFVLLTHNHRDHVGAAAKLIKQYKPSKLYLKRYYGNDDTDSVEFSASLYNSYIQSANSVGTSIVYMEDYKDGYTINLGKMVIRNYNTVNCMRPGYVFEGLDLAEGQKVSENVNSITSLVTVNGLKTYLTGDLSYKKFAVDIANQIGKVDVYKFAHHGLANGTRKEEVNILKPNHAIATIQSKYLAEEFPDNAIGRVPASTKVYYSGDNNIIVDYTSGVVKVTQTN